MNPDPLVEVLAEADEEGSDYYDLVGFYACRAAWLRENRDRLLAALDGKRHTDYAEVCERDNSVVLPLTRLVLADWQLVLAPGQQVWVFVANEQNNT